MVCWPYPASIALIERDGSDRQLHVIRNWHYLGSVGSEAEARQLDTVAAGFDADGYKILCKPVLSGGTEIIVL